MSKPPRPDAEPTKFAQTGQGGYKFNHLTQLGINIPFVMPSASKPVRGRILPCFDFDLDATSPEFRVSSVPYRDSNSVRDDEHCDWNQWFFPFEVYTFYGVNKRSFFSPKVRARLGLAESANEAHDPIARMNYLVCKDPKYTHLAYLAASTYNAPPGTPPPALGRARTMALMNFYGCHGEREEQNMVVMIPESGMDFVKAQLNKFRKPTSKVRDTKWPDYMFGDITHPETGLLAWSTQRVGFGDKMTNTLTFSKNDDSASDVEQVAVSQDVLAKRLNYFDVNNAIRVPTPQEALDWIIEDGQVPLEFIKEACGAYLNVPDAADTPAAPVNVQHYKTPGDVPMSPPTRDPIPPSDPDEDPDDDIPFLKSEKPVERPKTLTTDELESLKSDKGSLDYTNILSQLEKIKA